MNIEKEIAKRIKKILIEKGLNHEALADAIGLSRPTITQMLNTGAGLTLSKVVAMAKFLRINPTYLTFNVSESVEKLNKSHIIASGKPKLFLKEAAKWKQLTEKFIMEHHAERDFIVMSDKYSEQCFPLIIETDTNYPALNKGDEVIVDTTIKSPKTGSLAVVRILFNNQNVFAQYNDDGDKITLKYLNEKYPSITVNKENIEIIGVAVSKYQELFF